MRKQLLLMLIPFILLTGCVSRPVSPRHDVAVSFDAERIAYSVAGQGRTALVFVHGWSCDGRYWQEQVSEFQSDYRVITLDLAGHGHSSLTRQDLSMLSFAKDVKAVIDREGIDRAILVGHSMGGAVIAEAARLMPEKVVGIIGVDTLHNVAEQVPHSVIDEMTQPFESDFKAATQAFVSGMFPAAADRQLTDWVKEDMSSAPSETALSAFRNYLEQQASGKTAAIFEDITIPVISINSRLWPTAPEENRKHIRNYRLFYIEETGHFPMLEAPQAFNSMLRKSLESMPSGL